METKIKIKYFKKEEDEIRIFGSSFIINNKEKCKIIFKDKEYELKEYFEDIESNYDNINDIILILRLFDDITDFSYMFYKCNTLYSLNFSSELQFNNIKNMSNMFSGCNSLISLPDLSKLNIENVIDLSNLFSFCKSLIFEISHFETSDNDEHPENI